MLRVLQTGALLSLGALDLVWIHLALVPWALAPQVVPPTPPEVAIATPSLPNHPDADEQPSSVAAATVAAATVAAATVVASLDATGLPLESGDRVPLVTVIFPQTASIALTSDARDELLRIVEQLRETPKAGVRVIGYADAQGGNSYNERLGLRRAAAVRRFLRAQGIDRSRIRVWSEGERHPNVIDTSDRRVEISLTELE